MDRLIEPVSERQALEGGRPHDVVDGLVEVFPEPN